MLYGTLETVEHGNMLKGNMLQGNTLTVDEQQYGGDHYKTSAQHWNELPVMGYGFEYYTGQASKYLTRWRKKNGLPDLLKGQHFIEKLLDLAVSRGGKFLPFGHVKTDEGLQSVITDHMQSHLRYYFNINEVDDTTAAIIVLVLFANSPAMLVQAIDECKALAIVERKTADVNKATLNTQLPVAQLFDFVNYVDEGSAIRWKCKRCGELLQFELNEPPATMHKVCTGPNQ